jgi:S-adenosylmethionine uptake transporter
MSASQENPTIGILFIVFGMACISVNDVLIKSMSGDYPLHEIVFFRSFFGILFSFVILHFEGGIALLRTRRPLLHAVRALLVVMANMTFYAALVVMPLATTTALYFVAPLFITVLSIPVLGEKVGPRRIGAVLVGFVGVLVMMWPELSGQGIGVGWVAILPVISAAGYAGMSVLTRLLGMTTRASALAIYIQTAFIGISLAFFVFAGDGRFLTPDSPQSMVFLLRPWVWPASADWPYLFGLGALSGAIGYSLSQAYRMASAATVAPFEYIALPIAVFWGWSIFGEIPDPWMLMGAALIALSGVYVFARERAQKKS